MQFCADCASAYSAPYQVMDVPTLNPQTPPVCAQAIPLSPSPQTVNPYRYVNDLSSPYGDQGPNGNFLCGMTPIKSVPEMPLWNSRYAKCVPTQTQQQTNVDEYNNYVSSFSVDNPLNGKTLPTLAALLAPQNILQIKTTINAMLTQQFGFNIAIDDTPAFRQTINDVANENPRWMYDVHNGLPLLNNVIIQREFGVHQVALRQQLRYQRFLEGTYPRFMPYGSFDHSTKGETVNDSSTYTLTQPAAISYNCFLAQTGLRCP